MSTSSHAPQFSHEAIVVWVQNAFAIDEPNLSEIDWTFSTFHLFLLQHFEYYPSDFLFDSFSILLYFFYTSLEIKECIMNHFHHLFSIQDDLELASMKTKLLPELLEELHNLYDAETYFLGMSTPSSPSHGPSPTSLLGDIFCMKWFSISLSITINLWSLPTGKCYLSFTSNASDYE